MSSPEKRVQLRWGTKQTETKTQKAQTARTAQKSNEHVKSTVVDRQLTQGGNKNENHQEPRDTVVSDLAHPAWIDLTAQLCVCRLTARDGHPRARRGHLAVDRTLNVTRP